MRPHAFLVVSRTLLLSPFVVVFMACSSSKPKDEPAKHEALDASNDSKAKPPKPPECLNPSPVVLMFDSSPTGYVNCQGGVLHRSEIHTCPTRLPRTTTCGPPPADGGLLGSCHADSDCKTKPKGYCTVTSSSGSCFCDYGCTEDADCGQGQVCFCKDPIGECVPATCTSDGDCGGLLCLRSNDAACGQTFGCQTPTDPCTSNADCPPPYSSCQLQNGKRTCVQPGTCR